MYLVKVLSLLIWVWLRQNLRSVTFVQLNFGIVPTNINQLLSEVYVWFL